MFHSRLFFSKKGESSIKRVVFVLAIVVLVLVPSTVGAKGPCQGQECTTIQDGELYASDGELITVQELELIVPPEGVTAPIGMEIASEQPITGFRYVRAQD